MLDIHFIREHPDAVKAAARHKRVEVDIDALLTLDARRRELQRQVEDIGRQRNARAQSLAPRKDETSSASAASRTTLQEEGKSLKTASADLEHRLRDIQEQYDALLKRVPNIPTADTPVGADETANVVLRTWGELPSFTFPPKEHWELGAPLGLIDTERAAKVSGSRFAYLTGDGALLEFALLQFAISVLTNGERLTQIVTDAALTVPSTPFIPVIPPVLIRPDVFERMARLEPRDDRYYIPGDELFLIGSAEHALGAMHLDETFSETDLPRRYVGFSTAFRREAGSYGKDLRGLIRVHQFDKLEMESFTVPEMSLPEQEFLVAIQEYLLRALEIPYRVVLLCTGDMGAPNARQIDLEAWFPGQRRYRETHSADLMTDYQARRLRTKVRRSSGATTFVHMNDATALAMGRTIAAVIENYQQEDGNVRIPPVLQPYLGGRDTIRRSDSLRT